MLFKSVSLKVKCTCYTCAIDVTICRTRRTNSRTISPVVTPYQHFQLNPCLYKTIIIC